MLLYSKGKGKGKEDEIAGYWITSNERDLWPIWPEASFGTISIYGAFCYQWKQWKLKQEAQ